MSAPPTGNDYRPCTPADSGTQCAVHGGRYFAPTRRCQTMTVLAEVQAERARQFAEYGTNEDLADGTGEHIRWALPVSDKRAGVIEEHFRWDYETYEKTQGTVTWMHLVREELAEAFAETDPAKLRAEVLQVAALCVSWVEKLDSRPKTVR